jgi:hypothetical protein
MKEAMGKTGKPVLLALRPPEDPNGLMEFLDAQQAFVDAGFPALYSMRQLARAMFWVMAWKGPYPYSRRPVKNLQTVDTRLLC